MVIQNLNWDLHAENLSKKLSKPCFTIKNLKLQKRAIRLIANVSNKTSCQPFFNKLMIMTLPCIYIYEILVHIKMSLNRF